MLVDSGSDCSFVSNHLIDIFASYSCNTVPCTSFHGETYEISRCTSIKGEIDNFPVCETFYYSSLPKGIDFICGDDILSKHSAIISYYPKRGVKFLAESCNAYSCASTITNNESHFKANESELNFDVNENLSSEQTFELRKLLHEFKDSFSKGPNDVGRTNASKHTIDTGDNHPFKNRGYKIPHGLKDVSDDLIKEMLSNDIIQPSKSPWCNPYFLVKKKSGKYRFVLDFRRLNRLTKKDSFPLPLIEDIFADLRGSCFFSSLDLSNGYWQIELDDASKEKTAFVANNNLYEFNVLPYGVCNGPSTFQRTMQNILKDAACLPPYIDDVVIASNSWTDHLNGLKDVLSRLQNAGFKLNANKCSFAKDQIVYLGHLLTKEGIKPDPNKISSLMDMTSPTDCKGVQILYGFCNYLRSFIHNFAEIMSPISDLLQLKSKDFVWTSEAESAFQQIKLTLADQAQRHYPDFSRQFELSVDASSVAVAATLSQGGKPIAFESRLLSKAEKNYSTTDREFLALVTAFKKFRHYLVKHDCIVTSDHKPLLGLIKGKPRNGRHARYQQILEEFQFELRYIPGKDNVLPDTLSRLVSLNDEYVNDETLNALTMVNAMQSEILEAQMTDTECKSLLNSLREGSEFKSPLRAPDKWSIEQDSLLCHSNRIYVPQSKRENIVKRFHESGHFCTKTTVQKIRERYIFPNMWSIVRKVVSSCFTCQQQKNYGVKKAPCLSLPETGPFEFVCIDLVGPLTLSGNHKYLLTMMDNYTKWVEVAPLNCIDANSVAKAFIKSWIYRWGPPVVLHSDRGTQFESSLMTSVCEILGIKKSRTTAWHPEGNGSLERFHRTLKDRLRCSQRNWIDALDEVVFEFRATPNQSGSPFKRLLGFDVNIPADWPNKFVRHCDESSIQTLCSAFDKVKKSENETNSSTSYNAGQYVWVKRLNPKSIESPWLGPFMINKVIGPVTLDVETYGTIHVNRCKPCQLPLSSTD